MITINENNLIKNELLKEVCFSCGKKLKKINKKAITEDGQIVYVGTECFLKTKITKHGFKTYNGPTIYRLS